MSLKSAFKQGMKSVSGAELARMHNEFDRYSPLMNRGVSNNDRAELGVYSSGGASWVATAVNQKNTDISNIEFYFVDKNNKRVENKNVPDDIIRPVLKGYAGMGINQMLALSCVREDLSGNDLWIKKTDSNRYDQLFNVADQFIIVDGGNWKMRKKHGEYGIDKYIVNINGIQETYNPDQVIHFKRNNIIDPFVGIGLIAQHRLTVETDAVSAEYQKSFYEKDGSPNMVVIDKEMSDPELARTKGKQFRDNYRHGLYEQSVMYLYGDVDAKSMNISASDMDYVNNKVTNKDSTISIMESTPSVLGDEKASGNRAVSITATNNYYKKVNSRAQHLVDALNMQYIWMVDPKKDYTLTFKQYPTGDVLDIKVKVETGVLTRNEIREEIGYEPVESSAMDTNFINRGFAPIDQVFEGIAQEQVVKKNFY